MNWRSLFVITLVAITPVCLHAQVACTTVSGSYNLDGTGNSATGSGPWTLTATNTTASWVNFDPAQTFTFADLQQLSATFTSNSGGAAGGSPRISVALDVNGNGTYEPYPGGDGNIVILLGNAPDYVDTDAELNAWSNVNLIGNNDAGRYDTSHLAGGSPSTTYSDPTTGALAVGGSYTVLSVTFIEDTFDPYPSRNLTLNSINLCALVSDLTVTKTMTSDSEVTGSNVTYEIVVTNSGTGPTSGTVTVTDSPEGVTVTSMYGDGWDCDLGTLTCTRSDVLAAGASYPTIYVEGLISGSGTVRNTASVSGGGDTGTSNNSGTATFDAAAAPSDVPTLDFYALVALCAMLALFGARRMMA